MNYSEQQTYLVRSRLWVAFLVLVLLTPAVLCLLTADASAKTMVVFGLVIAASAISLAYTPDYLHLTVNPRKRLRWEIKIRWRIIAAALIVGLASYSNLRSVLLVLAAVAWVTAINWLDLKLPLGNYAPAYFWVTDFALVAFLLLSGLCNPLPGIALLAGAAHLSILICARKPLVWAIVMAVSAWLLMLVLKSQFGVSRELFFAGSGLVLASTGCTAWLVHRAQRWNSRNVEAALQELMEFTGYPAERVWRLWSESDQELARNWTKAALDENDSQALAEWYRQNSELYMFAISGYNLDYKRIRSNLKVLRFGRGACLDYGAGNGEVILELARRSHPAAYYDVDGVSAKFAKQRAQRRGLAVKFAHSKEALAASAQHQRFDTIFSLDVLEHLPDLEGELTFLASLLNPGGMLVFDVPAGTTKSHPMHLNHHVEVRSLLKAKGMREQRSAIYKLPFVKQEKYVFVAG